MHLLAALDFAVFSFIMNIYPLKSNSSLLSSVFPFLAHFLITKCKCMLQSLWMLINVFSSVHKEQEYCIRCETVPSNLSALTQELHEHDTTPAPHPANTASISLR